MSGSSSDFGPRGAKASDPATTSGPPADVDQQQPPANADDTAAIERAVDAAPKSGPTEPGPEGTGEGLRTAEEAERNAIPRPGPFLDDEPEAAPAHPKSLRVRADGNFALKGTRGGGNPDITGLPGSEQFEHALAVPSHPTKVEQDGQGGWRIAPAKLADAEDRIADEAAEAEKNAKSKK